jgi:predicted TIM-barrel fold metal-dependent hydrolase
LKAGRFVVDTHVHAQRFAAGKEVREMLKKHPETNSWNNLSIVMRDLIPYDNSQRLLYDMECYGVDMCVLLPAFGMTNELNLKLVEKYPDKFVAFCGVDEYEKRVRNGEEEWSIKGVCDELDRLLSTGKFVGIGEQLPYMPAHHDPQRPVSREEAVKNMLAIMEVAQHHKVAVRYHTGTPMGYQCPYSSGSLGPANFNPLWAHDLACAFPDVPLIFDHGGMQGWWSERWVEECMHVAASHDNVYLETGLWWTELYEKALIDPNIGPEKLLWGTDWGASMGFHSQPGHYPPSYGVQIRRKGPVVHQVDYWGWSLREITRLRISQDDLNLILGGNAVRLFNLPVPHKRLFRPREV